MHIVFSVESNKLRVADFPTEVGGFRFRPGYSAVHADNIVKMELIPSVINVCDHSSISKKPERAIPAILAVEGKDTASGKSIPSIGTHIKFEDVVVRYPPPAHRGIIGEKEHPDFAITVGRVVDSATFGTDRCGFAPRFSSVGTLGAQRSQVGLLVPDCPVPGGRWSTAEFK